MEEMVEGVMKGAMDGVMEDVMDGVDEEADNEEDTVLVVVVVTKLWTSTHLILFSDALNPALHVQTASRLALLKEGSLQKELAVPASQSSSLSHFLFSPGKHWPSSDLYPAGHLHFP